MSILLNESVPVGIFPITKRTTLWWSVLGWDLIAGIIFTFVLGFCYLCSRCVVSHYRKRLNRNVSYVKYGEKEVKKVAKDTVNFYVSDDEDFKNLKVVESLYMKLEKKKRFLYTFMHSIRRRWFLLLIFTMFIKLDGKGPIIIILSYSAFDIIVSIVISQFISKKSTFEYIMFFEYYIEKKIVKLFNIIFMGVVFIACICYYFIYLDGLSEKHFHCEFAVLNNTCYSQISDYTQCSYVQERDFPLLWLPFVGYTTNWDKVLYKCGIIDYGRFEYFKGLIFGVVNFVVMILKIIDYNEKSDKFFIEQMKKMYKKGLNFPFIEIPLRKLLIKSTGEMITEITHTLLFVKAFGRVREEKISKKFFNNIDFIYIRKSSAYDVGLLSYFFNDLVFENFHNIGKLKKKARVFVDQHKFFYYLQSSPKYDNKMAKCCLASCCSLYILLVLCLVLVLFALPSVLVILLLFQSVILIANLVSYFVFPTWGLFHFIVIKYINIKILIYFLMNILINTLTINLFDIFKSERAHDQNAYRRLKMNYSFKKPLKRYKKGKREIYHWIFEIIVGGITFLLIPKDVTFVIFSFGMKIFWKVRFFIMSMISPFLDTVSFLTDGDPDYDIKLPEDFDDDEPRFLRKDGVISFPLIKPYVLQKIKHKKSVIYDIIKERMKHIEDKVSNEEMVSLSKRIEYFNALVEFFLYLKDYEKVEISEDKKAIHFSNYNRTVYFSSDNYEDLKDQVEKLNAKLKEDVEDDKIIREKIERVQYIMGKQFCKFVFHSGEKEGKSIVNLDGGIEKIELDELGIELGCDHECHDHGHKSDSDDDDDDDGFFGKGKRCVIQ